MDIGLSPNSVACFRNNHIVKFSFDTSRGRSFCICPLVYGSNRRKTGGQTRKDRPFMLAGPMLFLNSDATSYVTGTAIKVDGG